MPREIIETFLDMDEAGNKRRLMMAVGALRGLYDISIQPRRNIRTNQQNKYYWAVVLEAVRLGISEAWGEELTKDEVHVLCRDMFLERPVVNRNTGEVVRVIAGSTTALSTGEMAAYIDKVIRWAGEFLGVEVPEADPNHGQVATAVPAGSSVCKPEDF